MAFEEELNALVQRTKVNDENPSRTASYETINRTLSENKKRHEIWMNDVDIFNKTTLIISKKPGNTGISRDIRTEFTTDLLLSD